MRSLTRPWLGAGTAAPSWWSPRKLCTARRPWPRTRPACWACLSGDAPPVWGPVCAWWRRSASTSGAGLAAARGPLPRLPRRGPRLGAAAGPCCGGLSAWTTGRATFGTCGLCPSVIERVSRATTEQTEEGGCAGQGGMKSPCCGGVGVVQAGAAAEAACPGARETPLALRRRTARSRKRHANQSTMESLRLAGLISSGEAGAEARSSSSPRERCQTGHVGRPSSTRGRQPIGL
mmetsp:Transcript_6522/g.26854  ORF Transcript_6522/g.26854 Transcript_6522/m.26854 type:complete len:234 (+) Transcript_6522:950-1651(+)